MSFIPETDDTLDLRALIERYEELESIKETTDDHAENPADYADYDPAVLRHMLLDEDDAEELAALTTLLDELKGMGGDEQWRGDWYPITLIRDDHFEEYAKELAEDIGAVNDDASWPCNHIDWTRAADALRMDYSTVEWGGVEYQYR